MRKNLLTVALASLLGAGMTASGDDPNSIKLNLLRKAQEYLLGEPVTLQIIFKNTGDKPRNLVKQPWGLGKLLASTDGRDFHPVDPSPGVIVCYTGAPAAVELGVGKEISENRLALLSSSNIFNAPAPLSWLVFPNAGTYWLKASYDSIESEPVKIVILEPQGAHLTAWKELSALSLAVYALVLDKPEELAVPLPPDIIDKLKEGSDSNTRQMLDLLSNIPDKVQQLGKVVERHPESVYSHYLALGMGRYHLKKYYTLAGQSPTSAETRASLGRARKYLEMAASRDQVPAVQEEAKRRLKELGK